MILRCAFVLEDRGVSGEPGAASCLSASAGKVAVLGMRVAKRFASTRGSRPRMGRAAREYTGNGEPAEPSAALPLQATSLT